MAAIDYIKVKAHMTRFTDRPIVSHLGKVKIKFFNRIGGQIRTVAKRSLRKASQKPLQELTERQRQNFESATSDFKAGKRHTKPRRPERIAKRGQPPLLHMKPKSPLRELILFSVDQSGESVVIGPSQFRSGNLKELEDRNPFMEPALIQVEPQIPQFLQAAKAV